MCVDSAERAGSAGLIHQMDRGLELQHVPTASRQSTKEKLYQ